jgi:nucleoside-diphosphate-sugar epimerase
VNEIANNKFDAVVFLAQSADYKKNSFSADLYEVNVHLLYRVLTLVADHTSKFIYFSTGSVYRKNNVGVYDEQSELDINSTSPYVTSKIAGELLVNSCKNIPVRIILRPFFVFGKEQKETMLFKSVYNKVQNGDKLQLAAGNGLVFNPVHAEDVAHLLQHLIMLELSDGQYVYNVAGGEEINLKDVIDIIVEKTDKKVNVDTDGVPGKFIAKVNIPGWTPQISIEEGLNRTFFE